MWKRRNVVLLPVSYQHPATTFAGIGDDLCVSNATDKFRDLILKTHYLITSVLYVWLCIL